VTALGAAPRTEAAWLALIGQARDRASHFVAYDLSVQALAAWPDSLAIEHRAILALASAGALNGALARYHALEQAGRLDDLPDHLAGEFTGLGGRLFKDLAARAGGEAALAHRLKSARTYEAGYHRLGTYYLAINAAAMYLAAGHAERAADYAAIAHDLAVRQGPDYWSLVTVAEAALILRNPDAAAAALRQAAGLGAARLADLATTRRQLTWVAQLTSTPVAVLDHLPRPRVFAWDSGRGVLPGPLSGTAISASGPLLGGADLAFVQALLAAGAAEVNLVLPCEPAEFCRDLPDLAATLPAVLAHDRVTTLIVTREGGAFEPAARALCQMQARGLAVLRAQSLAVAPDVFAAAGMSALPDVSGESAASVAGDAHVRTPQAIIFGDVRGFSKLDEPAQLRFLDHIIGGFADVLARFPVAYAETAGDGLFVVMPDIAAAAACGFALLDVLRPENVAAAGLPPHLALRLSAHVGPLYRRRDRVIGRDKFCGMEVIRTARIEPVTRAGEIFVTEQFAASLACVAADAFICEYVGVQPMAKGFGDCRMYSLRHATDPGPG